MLPQLARLLLVEDPNKPLMAIQELARSLSEIQGIDVRRNFDAAVQVLGQKSYEMILISDRYETQERLDFVRKARDTTEGGKDAALILVLQKEAAGSSMIAGKIMQGVDGILQEPYSADQLMDALKIAEKVRQKNLDERKKKAVDIALSDVMTYIEARTSNPNITYNKAVSQRALGRLQVTLKELEQTDSDAYFETVIEKFTAMAAKEKKLFEGGYRGASARVRKMMEKKAQKRVKEIAEGEEEENPSDEE